MSTILNQVWKFIISMRRVLRIRFDKSPIKSVPELVDFISTRAAYVAQTSLFGYLRTRMGREYVEIFTDEKFLPSIQRAKWELYAACLSDLTIYATSLAVQRSNYGHDNAAALARHIHLACLANTFEGEFAESFQEVTESAFIERSAVTIWANSVIGDVAFSLSPRTLIECAPVADEFKELDHEIVTNSIKLRWGDVRSQLSKRIDGAAIRTDFLRYTLQIPNALDIPRVKVTSPKGKP